MRHYRNATAALATALVVLLVIPAVFIGCPGAGGRSFAEQSPKERATWMLGVYNAEYRDYMNVVARPDLSEEQKDLLKQKKQILTDLYPLIGLYSETVMTGAVVPDRGLEDQILALINQLLIK
jgi:hypothetical protein